MRRVAPRTRLGLGAGLLGLVVVALAGAMWGWDRAERHQIAKGVRIAGVAVGGLSEPAARAKLERQVTGTMERPVTVRVNGRAWTIAPRQAGVTVDVNGSVARAVDAGRKGSIFERTWRYLTGGTVRADVPLAVSWSHILIRDFASRVRAAVDRPARDATVQPGGEGLRTVPAQDGVQVQSGALERRVEGALSGLSGSREVQAPTRILHPAVTTRELASRYPAYILIDRTKFELSFYSHLHLADTYPIAVGMQGLETPPGLYHIQWKQVDPPWYVPNSAWAGSLAGKVIPPGPQDPLKARFMSFDGGAGIHGIDPSEYGTIGHNASHGCVRMRIPDVIALYARTPVGTPVYIM